MTTQPNLDFYARVPTRREAATARLTEKRNVMYSWRGDADECVFDSKTGARQARVNLYAPVATRHSLHSQGKPSESRAATATARRSGGGGGVGGSAAQTTSRCTADAEETEAYWASAAAEKPGDRRRLWLQSNFTFSADYFGASVPPSQTHADGGGRSRAVEGEVYAPYLHDSIVFCSPIAPARPRTAGAEPRGTFVRRMRNEVVLAVTCNTAEARERELHAAEEAKRGELLSLSSLLPAQRGGPPQHSSALAASPTLCFEDDSAGPVRTAADEKEREAAVEVPSLLRSAPAHAADTQHPLHHSNHLLGSGDGSSRLRKRSTTAAVLPLSPVSLDEEGGSGPAEATPLNAGHQRSGMSPLHLASRSGSPRARGSGTAPRGQQTQKAPAESQVTTWCDLVGPVLASRQRAAVMAEGVYADLISREAQRTRSPRHSAAARRLASVNTSELAYSLRASYMASAQHHPRGHSHHNHQYYHHTNSSSSSGHTKNRATHSIITIGSSSGVHRGKAAQNASASATAGGVNSNSRSTVKRSSADTVDGTEQRTSSAQLQASNPQSPNWRSRASQARQRLASATAALSLSGAQGVGQQGAAPPHRRSVTAMGANGLSDASFLESSTMDSVTGYQEGNVGEGLSTEVPAMAVVHVASTPQSSPQPPPPPSIAATAVMPSQLLSKPGRGLTLSRELSEATASEHDSYAMSAASPLGCVGVELTAPPTLSQLDLEHHLAHDDHGHHAQQPKQQEQQQQQQQQREERELSEDPPRSSPRSSSQKNSNTRQPRSTRSSDRKTGHSSSGSGKRSPLAATARRCSHFTASTGSDLMSGHQHHGPLQCLTASSDRTTDSHWATTKSTGEYYYPANTTVTTTTSSSGNGRGGGSTRAPSHLPAPPCRHTQRQARQLRMLPARVMTRARSRRRRQRRTTTAMPGIEEKRDGDGVIGSRCGGAAEEQGRLPVVAKETCVYAVRLHNRATLGGAVESPWQEPPRRGVPVLLPDDWQ